MRNIVVVASFALAATLLFAGCGYRASSGDADAAGDTRQPTATPSQQSRDQPTAVATISDRSGPSWSGRLGDTVQVDWFDQSSRETHSERIAVLAVKRLPDPADDGDPDDDGPYEWEYAIKVRLTSLDETTARSPSAYQFLELSDGSRLMDGVAGMGTDGGPDPSSVGRSSVGWLHQRVQEGFTPTEVVLPIVVWEARWSLD